MIGRVVTYEVVTETGIETCFARIITAEFTAIGPVYICRTAFGHTIRLTRREISKVI